MSNPYYTAAELLLEEGTGAFDSPDGTLHRDEFTTYSYGGASSTTVVIRTSKCPKPIATRSHGTWTFNNYRTKTGEPYRGIIDALSLILTQRKEPQVRYYYGWGVSTTDKLN